MPRGVVRTGTPGPRMRPLPPTRLALQRNRPAVTWKLGPTWESSCHKFAVVQPSLLLGWSMNPRIDPHLPPAPEGAGPGLPPGLRRPCGCWDLSLSRQQKTRSFDRWKLGVTQTTSCLAAAWIQSCQYHGTKELSTQADGRGVLLAAGKEPSWRSGWPGWRAPWAEGTPAGPRGVVGHRAGSGWRPGPGLLPTPLHPRRSGLSQTC